MAEKIHSDTTNTKVIFLYSPACSSCSDEFLKVKTSMNTEMKSTTYYLMSLDNNRWDFAGNEIEELLNKKNVVCGWVNGLSIQDDEYNVWEIVRSIAIIDSAEFQDGLPQTIILSKDNHLIQLQ